MPDGAPTVERVGTGDRTSWTSFELAFLDGPPRYEADEAVEPVELEEETPGLVRVPSAERRAAALRLFFIIGGSAVLVLVLALLRLLWRALAS
jgi:hypothetical protein